MPKKLLHKLFPNMHGLRQHPQLLKIFGPLLLRENLWHINRRSISGAFAVGLFAAFVPIPLQTVIAALLAIVCRVNMPISILLVWITNPLTVAPIFYFCYKIGSLILATTANSSNFTFGWEWFKNDFIMVWQPLLLGCFITATVTAAIGYSLVRLYWRYYVVVYWRRRNSP